MAKKLRPWLERFHQHLKNKSGLNPIQNTKFRVRRDGGQISKEDVDNAFTQIRPAALTLSPGCRLKAKDADYDLVVELGRGAVAQVWKCQRIRDRKDFAVKIVDPRPDLLDPSTLDNVKHRFSREAQNGMRLGDRYVLGDLGIVRWSDMNPAFTSAGTITKASVQLGSWYYMAHEQRVAPHEATAASDIYALGIRPLCGLFRELCTRCAR